MGFRDESARFTFSSQESEPVHVIDAFESICARCKSSVSRQRCVYTRGKYLGLEITLWDDFHVCRSHTRGSGWEI